MRPLLVALAAFGAPFVAAVADAAPQRDEPSNQPRVTLASPLDLASLLDLCANQKHLRIEYDPKALKALTVSLRNEAGGLTDDELWALTGDLLATRGLAIVELPSSNVLSVVKLSEAAGFATPRPLQEALASDATFIAADIPLEHAAAKDVVDAVKSMISKSGGNVGPGAGNRSIVVADTRDRVTAIADVVVKLDRDAAELRTAAIERITPRALDATSLAAAVTAAVAARDAIAPAPMLGSVKPTADGAAILLVAPASVFDDWKALIASLDVRTPVETRTYTPTRFPLGDVARLIEATIGSGTATGSSATATTGSASGRDGFRIVEDILTGSLIVTATDAQHRRIEDLLSRLESAPVETQRPIRTFAIRNRDVVELLDVLQTLIDAGAINETVTSKEPFDAAAAGQRTVRPTLPPAGLTPSSAVKENSGTSTADTSSGKSEASGTKSSSAKTSGSTAHTSRDSAVSLTADTSTNTLIAMGSPIALAQLEHLIVELDVRQPQVMLEVMVVLLSDGDTLDLGVELQKLEQVGSTSVLLASLFGLGAPGVVSGAIADTTALGGTGIVLNPGDFSMLLRALETVNHGRTLNRPRILVNNNEQGTLDSVLSAPFLSTNASDTVATTSFGGSENAGTTVTIKPQIAAGDRLRLEYAVNLSSFTGDSTDPALPPPKQENKIQSVVSIPDGFTIAMGGLEVETETEAETRLPLIGRIPLLGELFKTRSRSNSHSRFYVFITAQVMRHEGFEDLRHASVPHIRDAEVDDAWPSVGPQVIR